MKKVFDVVIRFARAGNFETGEYLPVMVLNEKTDELYDIVFPGYEKIWKYNEKKGRYIGEPYGEDVE